MEDSQSERIIHRFPIKGRDDTLASEMLLLIQRSGGSL